MLWCSLKNRLLPNQKTEAKIRGKILNHFTKLGLPKYSTKNQWATTPDKVTILTIIFQGQRA
jgi:hypothetical protein